MINIDLPSLPSLPSLPERPYDPSSNPTTGGPLPVFSGATPGTGSGFAGLSRLGKLKRVAGGGTAAAAGDFVLGTGGIGDTAGSEIGVESPIDASPEDDVPEFDTADVQGVVEDVTGDTGSALLPEWFPANPRFYVVGAIAVGLLYLLGPLLEIVANATE